MTGEVTLRFRTIKCRRCKIIRIRGVQCPDCGLRPDDWEIDELTQRRRIIVRRIDDLVAEDRPARQLAWDVAQVGAEASEIVTDILASLAEAADPAATGDSLVAAVDRFVDFRSAVAKMDRLRPFLDVADLFQRFAAELDASVGGWVGAYRAVTPLEAQTLSSQAQKHLDTAGEIFGRFTSRQQILDNVDTSTTGALLRSTLMAQLTLNDLDLAELFGQTEHRIQSLIGATDTSAISLSFAITEATAERAFDHARFIQVFVDSYKIFATGRQELTSLTTTSPEFLDDWASEQTALFNSFWRLQIITERTPTDRQLIEALLDIHTTVIEGPAALVTRALLTAAKIKTQPYTKLKAGNATDQLRRAKEDPRLLRLLDGLDEDLRSAHSHHQIDYLPDSIKATARKVTRKIEQDSLLDLILTGVESAAAALLALTQVMTEAGVDLPQQRLAEDIGISPTDLIDTWVGTMTQLSSVTELDDDGLLSITIDGDFATPRLSLLAGAFATTTVEGATHFRLTTTSGTQIQVLEGPITAFTAAESTTDDTRAQINLITTISQITTNGTPLLSEQMLRTFCVSVTQSHMLAAAKDPRQLPNAARIVRQLRQLASTSQDDELEATLRLAARDLRRATVSTEVASQLAKLNADIDFSLP